MKGGWLAWCGVALIAATACRGRVLSPAELAECGTLAPLSLVLSLQRVRVNAPAPLGATGGSGFYKFGVASGGSGGQIRGDRYLAGPSAATDTLFVEDQVCLTRSERALEVLPAFDAAPSRAVLPPARTLQIVTAGLLGTARFSFTDNRSGGTLSATGLYTAGPTPATDLIDVVDEGSGDQAQLRFVVRAGATFRAQPNALAAPAGGQVLLTATDATDRVIWRKKVPGEWGTLVGSVLSFPEEATGVTTVEAYDPFLDQVAEARVVVLDELTRPTVPHGRLTDVAAVVTADFNRDGFEDVALGVPESDLGEARGGAVFFFLGSAQGYAEAPGWRRTGGLGASFGTALAVGDINHDGFPDLAVGAPNEDVTVADSGGVHLFRFDQQGPVLLRRAMTGNGNGRFGSALALEDVDGDGDHDLVVGSPLGDLASLGNRRGVIDVFLLQPGSAILDYAQLRLSGWDLEPDGTAVSRAQTRSAASLAVADFNGDGRMDLASLGTITHRLVDGQALAAAQPGIQIFFGRTQDRPWEAAPDLFVGLRDPADSFEGTYRLGFIPGDLGRPPLLAVAVDRADAPDLTASGGRSAAGDAGGIFLFDLTAQQPRGTPAAKPVQLGRAEAFARFYGNNAGIAAGRSFTVANVDGVAGPELVLGAPYATAGTGASSIRLAGRALAFPLTALEAGTAMNVPPLAIEGADTSCFGTALATSSSGLLSFSARASTAQGAFTGRLEVLTRSPAAFDAWPRVGLPIPARAAEENYGLQLAGLRNASGVATALISSPGFAGPGVNNDGNDLNAGRAWVLPLPTGAAGVAAEGASAPLIRAGREVGADVSSTDFDGDGRLDLVIGAPNLVIPSTGSRAADITPFYALERAECVTSSTGATGGVQVHLGQADGTFKSAYRLWAPRTIAGCTTNCTRSGIGREVAGGFDFNGDGRGDVAATRSNGIELFLGRAPDDAQLNKLTMSCDPLFTGTYPLATSGVTAIGDLNADGCDEVAFRMGDTGTRSSVVIAFGYDPGGARCGGRTVPSLVQLADRDAGVQFLGLGLAVARVGRFLDDGKDYLAISATSYPVGGVDQDVVLLYDVAQIAARRPASGTTVVGGIVDLTPVPFVPQKRVRTFGRALAAAVNFPGEAHPVLVVGAPGDTVEGSEQATGAVYVFRGGRPVSAMEEILHVVGDAREVGDFGLALELVPAGTERPQLLIGAPRSNRTGARNGTAFALPLGF